MRIARRRGAVVSLFVSAALVLSAGMAAAVSSGGYKPTRQGCSPTADANNGGVERRCHNFELNLRDGKGHKYSRAGIDQEARDENPHSGDASVDTNGNPAADGPGASLAFDTKYQPFSPDSCGLFDAAFAAFEEVLFLLGQGDQPCSFTPEAPAGPPKVKGPTPHAGTPNGSLVNLLTSASLYLGADDNLDSGEHDGVDGQNGTANSANGPSDGGAIVVNWHPTDLAGTLLGLLFGPPGSPGALLSNPVPAADAGFGSCADGICESVQTRKRLVYKGGSHGQRNVYDYEGKKWDPDQCSSGNATDETNCHGANPDDPQTMDQYRADEKNVYAEPGAQVYEDPDPQGSPVLPHPLPAAYAGTCGVAAGGGPAGQVPEGVPGRNDAGQVVVSTGC